MNQVILMGRLTRDAEMKTSGDTKIAKFTLAVDRRYANKDGEREADFISCSAFGKTAEWIEKYTQKGKKILITGEWRTGSFTDKEGKKVYTNDCVISNAEFAESKGSENHGGTQASADDDFINIPDSVKNDMPF